MHGSKKMSPNQAIKKTNEKEVYSKFQDTRQKQTPNINIGQLVRTADIKKNFSKGDSTNYCYKLYSITEVFQDTIPSY